MFAKSQNKSTKSVNTKNTNKHGCGQWAGGYAVLSFAKFFAGCVNQVHVGRKKGIKNG